MYYFALMNFGGAAGSASSGSGTGAGGGGGIGMIIMLVAMFGIMYFMMIRPQKKKQKEEQAMRDNVQIGDEITTIGGIVGRVVTVKDDSLIIETGADRNKMKVMRWAIGTNNTANEKIEAERQAAKEAAEAEKLAKTEESKQKSLQEKVDEVGQREAGSATGGGTNVEGVAGGGYIVEEKANDIREAIGQEREVLASKATAVVALIGRHGLVGKEPKE